MPGAATFMTAMWPVFLLAVVSGVTFDIVKWVISKVRRHIYNQNRNRKYGETKRPDRRGERKNMTWRTEKPRDWRKAPLPCPSGFAEDLCRQWDKVHDSHEELIRFGEMMIELEDYVDNSFIFDYKGDIVRRHPGIKGFLAEKCPHIGYVTAIRYRLLAMKAREVVRKHGDVAKIYAQCPAVCELVKKFDKRLRVKHRHLECPRQRHCRQKADRTPQCAIFSLRETAHSARMLDTPRRQRVVNALLELARELSA